MENPKPKKSRKLDEETEEAVMMLTLGYGGAKKRRKVVKQEEEEEGEGVTVLTEEMQEVELEETFLQFKAVIAVKLEGQGWPP